MFPHFPELQYSHARLIKLLETLTLLRVEYPDKKLHNIIHALDTTPDSTPPERLYQDLLLALYKDCEKQFGMFGDKQLRDRLMTVFTDELDIVWDREAANGLLKPRFRLGELYDFLDFMAHVQTMRNFDPVLTTLFNITSEMMLDEMLYDEKTRLGMTKEGAENYNRGIVDNTQALFGSTVTRRVRFQDLRQLVKKYKSQHKKIVQAVFNHVLTAYRVDNRLQARPKPVAVQMPMTRRMPKN